MENDAMSVFITYATRTKCKKCGSKKFFQVEDEDDGHNIPQCAKCFVGKPLLYRVGFSIPELGTNRFKKVFKSKNEVGERLDTLTKAKNYKSFIENKLKKEGLNFDPREIGTESERKIFVIEFLSQEYVKYQYKRLKKEQITPGGLAKKLGILKNQVIPIFGKCNVKQINHSLVERYLMNAVVSDSMYNEIIKELRAILNFAAVNTLIQAVPPLPKLQRQKTFKVEDFYTEAERNLVIGNIKKRSHQIAILMLTHYVARQSEIRCLRWKDINFKYETISFSRHISEGKGLARTQELDGLKSSPEAKLIYPFFPGLREMLIEMTPSLSGEDLVFQGRGGNYLGKNVLWSAWTRSVDDLIEKKQLNKKVDLHRGTRSSTLSILLEKGHSMQELNELYGGNLRTMEKHYAKRKMQNVVSIFEKGV
tara:strand:+ start:2646 stop:3911 length:1266 start_codon:yes stop_codon:yes gene_type:complete